MHYLCQVRRKKTQAKKSINPHGLLDQIKHLDWRISASCKELKIANHLAMYSKHGVGSFQWLS